MMEVLTWPLQAPRAVNGLLLDHFGIEKWSSRRITFARTKNRIFPFPQCLIDHSLKYAARPGSWEFEVGKINFVFAEQPKCRAEDTPFDMHGLTEGKLFRQHPKKKIHAHIHSCVAETKVFLFTYELHFMVEWSSIVVLDGKSCRCRSKFSSNLISFILFIPV